MKKVLVACEESQRVCMAFRNKGFESYSCDLLPCSGGHPEWHIQVDVYKLLFEKGYPNYMFMTQDGKWHDYNWCWDLIIAHPPCTYLAVCGNKYFNVDKYGFKAIKRNAERKEAIWFFMNFVNAPCEHIAIENPIGIMSTHYSKPTQIIHPYMFGEPQRKATCLWLKGLPKLEPTNIVEPVIIKHASGKTDDPWHFETLKLPAAERSRMRSKTFQGIADAMAEQWGDFLNDGISNL